MPATKQLRLPETANLHSTRQLLDELDALMEKMLALPVGESDVPLAPPPELRLPTVSATLTVLDAPSAAPEDAASSLPLSREESLASPTRWSPAPRPQDPAEPPSYQVDLGSNAWKSEEAEAPRVEPTWEAPAFTDDPIPPSILDLKVPEIQPMVVSGPTLGSVAWEPVYWFNQLFDFGLSWLGPPGRWLRTSGGRTLLGYSGLGLLAAAAGWLIKDWMGWSK